MNEMNNPLDSSQMEEGLRLNAEMLGYLKDSAKWARFLAIIGFVFVGLMVIASFTMGAAMSSFGARGLGGAGGGLVTIIYLIFAAIYFFPLLYLYRFGSNMRNALNTNDNLLLAESLSNLRKHYNFLGILTAIILILYGVIFLIVIVGGVASGF